MASQDGERRDRDAPSFEPEPPAPGVESADATSAAQRLAGATGNRAFTQILARAGAGSALGPGGVVHPDVGAVIDAARGSGQPLDRGVARDLEPSLGPLGDVRVHADAEADVLARSVEARAFTTGSDVFFAAGEYQPQTGSGRALLAHELTHVDQQRGGPSSGPFVVSQPGDAQELDAEAASRELGG